MKNLFVNKSKIHGQGLFTKTPIQKTTGGMVVFDRNGNLEPLARKINHTDFPNSEPIIQDDMVVLIAKRNINSGEEITVDYGKWNETLPYKYNTMDFRNQNKNPNTMNNLSEGVIAGDDNAMYNADGTKSVEQTRSEIIEKRINLLIDWMGAEQMAGSTFGDYLNEQNIQLASFLSDLPLEYQFQEIDKISLSDPDAVDSLVEYMNDLNVLNAEQYEKYDEQKADEMADAMTDTVYMNAYGEDDEWQEAKGKRKAKRAQRKEDQKAAGGLKGKEARAAKKKARQEAKEARKKAKAEKKAIKKQLKADVKSGKISKKDKRGAMKDARKDFREKAGGSFVGRAGRKYRKFDPGLALMRNSYNSLLRLNFANQAYHLGRIMDQNGEFWKKIKKLWANFGGEIFSLQNNIKLARDKKPLLGKKKYGADGYPTYEFHNVIGLVCTTESQNWIPIEMDKLWSKFGKEDFILESIGYCKSKNPVLVKDGDGEFFSVAPVPAVAAAAWVALATAGLGAVGGVIKSFKKDKGEPEVEGEDNLDLPEDTTGTDDLKAETEKILAGTDTPEDDDEGDGGIMDSIAEYKWWIIGTLGVLGIAGILISVMGKKKV